jgi:hypothetical protein
MRSWAFENTLICQKRSCIPLGMLLLLSCSRLTGKIRQRQKKTVQRPAHLSDITGSPSHLVSIKKTTIEGFECVYIY